MTLSLYLTCGAARQVMIRHGHKAGSLSCQRYLGLHVGVEPRYEMVESHRLSRAHYTVGD